MARPPALSFLLIAGALLAACGNGERRNRAPATPPHAPPAPTFRLVFMTDLEGYLEPCGCRSISLGGIDRAVARVITLRADGVPSAVFAAGDLFFESGGNHRRDDEGARAQEVWKAETLTDVLGTIPLALAVNGPGDLRYGRGPLSQLIARAAFPLCGLVPDKPHLRQGHRLLSLGRAKVGVWFYAEGKKPVPTAELAEAASSAAAGLRANGAAAVLAITVMNPRDTRRLLAATEGVDFVVAAGHKHDDPRPPEPIGDGHLFTGGRHGRGLLVIEPAVHRAGLPFADHSAWTRHAASQARQERAQDLARRIAGWERDSTVDPQQLARQRARLKALRQPSPTQPTAIAGQNTFRARYIPLPDSAPRHPQTLARLAAYNARVNEHNRKAFADRKPPQAAPGTAVYVGSTTCNACHTAAYEWWQGHAHGHAYTTLVTRNKQYNLSCVGCHVTGYGQPGGSTVTHNAGLVHVGCESCHGPGSLHLDGPPEHIVAAPTPSTCLGCHNAEHSDQFDFATYRAQLLVPGHGLPLPDTAL